MPPTPDRSGAARLDDAGERRTHTNSDRLSIATNNFIALPLRQTARQRDRDRQLRRDALKGASVLEAELTRCARPRHEDADDGAVERKLDGHVGRRKFAVLRDRDRLRVEQLLDSIQ